MIVQSNRPWKWRYGGAIFRENFKGNIRKNCKCYYRKPIDNNFPWSSVIEVRNVKKCHNVKKICSKTARLRLLVSLEFGQLLTSFRYDLLNLNYSPKMINPEKNSVSYSKTSNTTHWMYYPVPFRSVWRVICSCSRYHRRVITVYRSFSH